MPLGADKNKKNSSKQLPKSKLPTSVKKKNQSVSIAAVPPPKLALVLDNAGWKKIPRLKTRLQLAAETAAAHLPKKFRFPFTATVLLTGDAKIRRLNHDFRGIDQPTNVLSFPQFDPAELPKFGTFSQPVPIGDIALALPYIEKESRQNNKLLINHVTHLVIHGLLHLFGYDHGVDREAEEMEGLERKIMDSLHLPDPYLVAPQKNAKMMQRKKRMPKNER